MNGFIPLLSLPGKPYGLFFVFLGGAEPVFGSFFPYGHFLLAGGRIWRYETRIFGQLVDKKP